jgi:hypothetical protein
MFQPVPTRAKPDGSDAPWIDYRASLARSDHRCDPPVCPVCDCEMDVHPVPHRPGCPEQEDT